MGRKFIFKQLNAPMEDGLIYYLDFGNPACYPGTGTVATDLVMMDTFNINPSAVYDPSNGGIFNTNGAGFLGTSVNIPTELLGNVAWSVGGWFKLFSNYSNGSPWGFGKQDTRNNFNGFSPNSNEIAVSLTNINAFGTSQVFSMSDWKYVVWTKSAGVFSRANCEIYVNNVKYTGGSLINIYGDETQIPNILGDMKIALGATSTALTQVSSLKFGEFKIYDKVLSSTEVNDNYLAGAGRYY